MNISFYNYKSLYLNKQKKYQKIINKNLSTGEFILGDELELFEKRICKYLNVKFCLGVSSATSAMEIGLKSIDSSYKNEIILPSHTFVATVDAIYNAGFKPIVIDINKDGLLNPKELSKAITNNTFGVMAVNINGNSCNYKQIKSITKKNHIYLFEDNAQAFGAKVNTRFTGTFGLFGALSFYPTKILGCFGDGGAIITNNSNLYNTAKLIRNHGRNKKGNIISWGTNSRLDNMQAAILNENLDNVENLINKRIKLANLFYELLRINPNIYFTNKIKDKKIRHVYQNFEILVKQRNALKNYLMSFGIETLIQWRGVPINKLKLNKMPNKNLKQTDYYFEHCLCLPINNSLSEYKVRFIAKKINQFYSI